MGLFKRGRVWWMRFTYKGRQIRKSTEVEDKKLAEKIYAKVMTQIAEGKWFEREIGADKTLGDMMEKYLAEYSIAKTPNGQIRDKYSARHLLVAFGTPVLTEITPSMIVDYKAQRKKEGIAPATLERELCLMKRAFNLAIREWEWVKENPVSKVSRERFNNQIDRWLTLEEEARLLNVCSDWLRPIVIFALNTGMRQGEILNLKWDCVDIFRKSVIVMESKNGERRTIPLNQAALEVLKSMAKIRYIRNNYNYVFASQIGTKKERGNLKRGFRIALEKAGIENFRFHDLRHTFATRLAQSRVDIYTIAKLLGHKDIRMTQRYAHHCAESLRGGVEVLDKISTILAQSPESGVSPNV